MHAVLAVFVVIYALSVFTCVFCSFGNSWLCAGVMDGLAGLWAGLRGVLSRALGAARRARSRVRAWWRRVIKDKRGARQGAGTNENELEVNLLDISPERACLYDNAEGEDPCAYADFGDGYV